MTHDTEALTERLARAASPEAFGDAWVHSGPGANIARLMQAEAQTEARNAIRAALASITGSGWRLVPEVATEEVAALIAKLRLGALVRNNGTMLVNGMHVQTGEIRARAHPDALQAADMLELLNAAPAIGEAGSNGNHRCFHCRALLVRMGGG